MIDFKRKEIEAMVLINIPQSTVKGLPGEMYASIIVFLIIAVLCIIVKIKSRKVDPLKKPKGIMHLAEIFVTFVDNMVEENMGKQFKKVAPYIGFLCMYIFLSFVIGLLGIPSPITYYMIPLSLALITFLMIHITSIIYTKWRYFKRYVDPIPFLFFIFLPINLISMWTPLLSLSFRLFTNALSGWVLMSLVYSALESLSSVFFGLPIQALITPALHAYFDVFSGFIQTTVFVFLTMLLVNSEVPEEIEFEKQTTVQ